MSNGFFQSFIGVVVRSSNCCSTKTTAKVKEIDNQRKKKDKM